VNVNLLVISSGQVLLTSFAACHFGDVNALNDDILAKLWIYGQMKLLVIVTLIGHLRFCSIAYV
jgi:hypothetical protein